MEQIYTDFTTKLLPKIAEGIMITKDYFMDLFGRYIHYIIIRESITLVISMIVLIVTIYVCYRVYKSFINYDGYDNSHYMLSILLLLPLFISICAIYDSSNTIIKAMYVPELVIYQEIKSFQNK